MADNLYTTLKPRKMRCINKTGSLMLTNLIISIISGAISGNALGGVLKKLNLGALGNTIAGAIGGGAGSQIMGMLSGGEGAAPLAGMAEAAGAGDMGSMISAVVAGGAGGGALTGILAMVKKMTDRGE